MHFPLLRYSKSTLCFISITLLGVSCSSNAKLELSPVRGKVLVKDKPAGVLLVFIPASGEDRNALGAHCDHFQKTALSQ